MNEVQTKIAELQQKGWTLAALADELDVTINAVEKWKAGERYPRNAKAVFMLLDKLSERKRIPKQKRYVRVANMKNRAELEKEKQQLAEELSELNLRISRNDTASDKNGKLDWNRDDQTQLLVEEVEKKQARLREINDFLGCQNNL